MIFNFMQIFQDLSRITASISTAALDMAEDVSTIVKEKSYLHQMATSVDWEHFGEKAFGWIVNFSGRVVAAIVVFFLLRWIIGSINKRLKRSIAKKGSGSTLLPFLRSVIGITLYACMAIVIVLILGVKASSLVALFASAGVAIGLALSGMLQNFAGGLMILLHRPFKVGDFIEAQGQAGVVKEIQIANTIILTVDNKTIYIPNGSLSSGILNNATMQDRRRVEWKIGISYGDNFEKAKTLLESMFRADPRILTDPTPFVSIDALADSSVNIVARVWVNPDDFWGVFYSINEKVYSDFPAHNLHFPFPQMDVHVNPTV